MNEMEKNLPKDAEILDVDKDMPVAYIADTGIMANTRKIKTKDHTTFGDFSRAIVDYIQNSAKNADRIDFVFDSYFETSIKDSERRRRETTCPIQLNEIKEETPLPVQMERFWGASRNKVQLQMLLHQEAIRRTKERPSNVKLVVSSFSDDLEEVRCISCCNGTHSEIPELCLDIEEADTRIIPHAAHAVEQGIIFSEQLVVLSPDTDVFVLLL